MKMQMKKTLGTGRFALLPAAVIVLAAPAMAQFNAGFLGGFAGAVAKEGVPDFQDTKFSGAGTYGAALNYRKANGLSIGLKAEQVTMTLREGTDEMGRLKLTPLMATLGYQGRPKEGRGFTGHAQFGGGIALAEFQKGLAITGLERQYGALIDATVKNAPVFEIGGGADYFLNRHVSLTSDFRILITMVGTSWAAVGRQRVEIPDINKFNPSSAQILGGVRFWLR